MMVRRLIGQDKEINMTASLSTHVGWTPYPKEYNRAGTSKWRTLITIYHWGGLWNFLEAHLRGQNQRKYYWQRYLFHGCTERYCTSDWLLYRRQLWGQCHLLFTHPTDAQALKCKEIRKPPKDNNVVHQYDTCYIFCFRLYSSIVLWWVHCSGIPN